MPRRGMGVEIALGDDDEPKVVVMPRRGMGVEMFFLTVLRYFLISSCPAGAWE